MVKRVLIVDDEPAVVSSIQRILHRFGYETSVASDGMQAGTLLESFSPAVMILDLKMPGLSGFDVIRFVRGKDHLKDIKILVVSAMPQDQLEEALAIGADDILGKPFHNEFLLEKISHLTNLDGANEGDIDGRSALPQAPDT